MFDQWLNQTDQWPSGHKALASKAVDSSTILGWTKQKTINNAVHSFRA